MMSKGLCVISVFFGLSFLSLTALTPSLFEFWALSMVGSVFTSAGFFLGGKEDWQDSARSALLYLYIQSFGSMLLLFGGTLASYTWDTSCYWLGSMMESIVCLSFCFKLGLFPFQFWVVKVYSSCGWFIIFLGLTFFKFYLLVGLPIASSSQMAVMQISSVGSLVAGGLGAMNYGNLKPMVSWISVADGGWGVMAKFGGYAYLKGYILSSLVVMGSLCYYFYYFSVDEFSSLVSVSSHTGRFVGFVLLGSFAGLSPLTGFGTKMICLKCISEFDWAWAMVGLLSSGMCLIAVSYHMGSMMAHPASVLGHEGEQVSAQFAILVLLSFLFVLAMLWV